MDTQQLKYLNYWATQLIELLDEIEPQVNIWINNIPKQKNFEYTDIIKNEIITGFKDENIVIFSLVDILYSTSKSSYEPCYDTNIIHHNEKNLEKALLLKKLVSFITETLNEEYSLYYFEPLDKQFIFYRRLANVVLKLTALDS